MIYLASPYSYKHDDPKIIMMMKNARFEAVCRAAAEIMGRGLLVFSPIAHSHPIAAFGGDFEYWQEFDETILGACIELWVLKIEGWEESSGIENEIRIATNLGLPVSRVDPREFGVPQYIGGICMYQ
jgi:hypothetical protein